MRELVAVPVEPDVIARALARHPDYRVLRRLAPMVRRLPSPRDVPSEVVGIAVDVETTGLDFRTHEVIELAVQRFRMDGMGRIIETGRPRSWLQQPSEPIPPVITEVTGLTDAHVAGRAISDGEATSMILDASFVVSHNAAFDRPFLERRLPLAVGQPWACSLNDFDWREAGFEGRTLSALLSGVGWFYDPHRAETDVNALLHLLDHRLETSAGTVGRRIYETARRPTWTVEAVDAPFSAREVLRQRGYRWNAERRAWSTTVGPAEVADERAWACLMLYGGRREPVTRMIDWTERYGER